MAEHMIAALPRLGRSCLDEEHCTLTISTQFILSVYIVMKKLVAQKLNYLERFSGEFIDYFSLQMTVWKKKTFE